MVHFSKQPFAALAALALAFFSFNAPAQSAAASAPKAKPAPAAKAKPAAKSPAVTAKPGEKLEEVAVLETEAGTIVVRFFPEVAPGHVANFKNLVKTGFYNGTRFHRIVPGFMIQGGDPNTRDMAKRAMWGTGGHMGADGKEITVKAEFNKVHHLPGILSMARSSDPNSASSQFFIVHGDAQFLDNNYTAFGEVVSGLDIVDKIVKAPRTGELANEPVAIKAGHLETRSLPPSDSLAKAGVAPAK
jgi:peptidyl-prolyl cis-trans isomerase B (cyclophilin B)